ncbi:TIGR00730 family Rossman fold protein [Roseovarius aestuarii]|nr:TIGR00730 family Rossman fold protein [Roseovarius aestuarii]
MRQHSVCVFCGARSGVKPVYEQAAQEFGTALAAAGWGLTYGAGDIGLMGAVADAAQNAGGDTFGVMPKLLEGWEGVKPNLTHYVLTETMHERKKVMFMNCDAIVLLPGGAGSLDEFFEVLTWRQLGMHEKPIILLDVEGYWQPLLHLLEHVIVEGFADGSIRDFYSVSTDVPSALDTLRATLS